MTDDRLFKLQGSNPVNARHLDPDKTRLKRYAAALQNAAGRFTREQPDGPEMIDVLADAATAVADEDIRSAVSRMVDENARLRAELEEAREECRIARRREVRYNGDLDRAQVEIARLRAELDENTGVLKALRRQRDKAEATISRVRAVLDSADLSDRETGFFMDIRAALDDTA